MSPRIVIELNQQQDELIDRLVEEGEYGSTPGEVIANVFRLFRLEHPEVLEDARSSGGDHDD